jgi:glycosyltransferase involved in cell wall biosynthesis
MTTWNAYSMRAHSTAVLIPCFNEVTTIATVIAEFRRALPHAAIFVFDNNSTDGTAAVALAAGAIVRPVTRQGKGNVVRRMFADVDADIYVLVDGDATYDATSAPAMIDTLLTQNLDMVVGARVHTSSEAYRAGHRWGNRALTRTMSMIFGEVFTDMLSGYRVFSRRFVKSFPALSHGFETETELTIHAMELRMPCAEIQVSYGARPQGSNSKLNTWKDGVRILTTILKLFAIERPLLFYSIIAAALMLVAIVLGIPLLQTFLQTGLVPRFPTAILCTGLAVLSALALVTGLIQEAVSVGRRETKQFQYLSVASLSSAEPGPIVTARDP